MSWLRVLTALVTLGLLICGAAAQVPPGLPDGPHITVVGDGSAEGPADSLDITFRIEVVKKEAAAAKSLVDEHAAKLIRSLQDVGVEHDQLSVTELTLSIEYVYAEEVEVAVGYTASRSVDLSLTTFDLFDAVVQKAIDSGVASIHRPQLRTTKEQELTHLAQARAIEQATTQAQAIAAGFGRKLGPVYSVATKEARMWSRRSTLFGDPGDSRLLRFNPGPIKIRQQIYATFLLEPMAP